jgi:deoxyribose-phosphate aldolase
VLEFREMSSLSVHPEEQLKSGEWQTIAGQIDHTLLRPDATSNDVAKLCDEAVRYGFASVFVHPTYLALAVSLLHGSGVKPGTPVGFPFGANLTTTKRAEAEQALRVGARELDMVLNVGALKSGDRRLVESDIRGVVEIAHAGGAILKVILETGLLTLEEKILACELAVAANADFVKTCTGVNGGGATFDDVALMRGVVGTRAGVKASGGVRTLAAVNSMIAAGANRIGTSSAIHIMKEAGAEL